MAEEQRLPAGFRFFPTDEELVGYYLARKAMDAAFTCAAIRDVDLYASDPWDLPSNSSAASTGGGEGGGGGGECCYFFCMRSSKHPTSGARVRRATAGGYWKSTGKDKGVYAGNGSGQLVGTKKTLVFYGGRAPRGHKTSWVMHEYSRAPGGNLPRRAQGGEWVICRVFMKKPPSDQYCTSLEMEQEAETTTTAAAAAAAQKHFLPAVAQPPSGPPPSCRSGGGGRAATRYGGDHEEDDDHSTARDQEPPMISSLCASPSSSWLLSSNADQLVHITHGHLTCASPSDDLPELVEFGDIYGGRMDYQQQQASPSNSVGSFLDERYFWNF
ncbi:NAC domain-containing protein 46 [Oryza brachyantha]|uniref:NAC domain-containing protein 46 n=1 Tax=Oryza brachyantha TaxID=4533 RepID=UPI001ADACD57|nr:NAC domain-containing protein 46 [Oryza brachyantha]